MPENLGLFFHEEPRYSLEQRVFTLFVYVVAVYLNLSSSLIALKSVADSECTNLGYVHC